jgi:hypothetical protein
MKTLDEHNKERRAIYGAIQNAMTRPHKNGIACPKCGAELYDSDPGITLTSNPPQKNVRCDCGFTGYRVA